MLSKYMFNGSKNQVVTVGIRAFILTPYLTLSHKVVHSNSINYFKILVPFNYFLSLLNYYRRDDGDYSSTDRKGSQSN